MTGRRDVATLPDFSDAERPCVPSSFARTRSSLHSRSILFRNRVFQKVGFYACYYSCTPSAYSYWAGDAISVVLKTRMDTLSNPIMPLAFRLFWNRLMYRSAPLEDTGITKGTSVIVMLCTGLLSMSRRVPVIVISNRLVVGSTIMVT